MLSSPWTPPDVHEGDAGDARALTPSDLALPAVLGGVLPLSMAWCSACLGLTILAIPAALMCTAAGGALAGANVCRRREGPLGMWAAAVTGIVLAGIQVLPCVPIVGVSLFAPDGNDPPNPGFEIFLAALLVVAAGLYGTFGSAGAALGHIGARSGTFGPAWTGPSAGPPPSTQMRIAGVALATLLGLGAVVVCGGFAFLTMLGSALNQTFEKVGEEVENP